MNLLYLLKTLKTKKLSELVASIEAPPIDVNLAVWDAIDAGDIEVDEEKDRVKALKESEAWHNPELSTKLIRVIQHYTQNETNVTRGRLVAYIKDPISQDGYPLHEYLMTLQYLIDQGQIIELSIAVPELKGKRPYHKFVFLCLPENENEEWNSKAVNKWIEDWEKK